MPSVNSVNHSINPFYNTTNTSNPNSISSNSTFQTVPSRPASIPPPLPPMPSNIPKIPQRSATSSSVLQSQMSNRSSLINMNQEIKEIDKLCSNPFFQQKKLKDYDILNNPGDIKQQEPLPFFRQDHFK